MGARVGLCIVLFEDCSAFTHVTACTLAGSPNVTRYIKGFSYFVTSITAPIASGWSYNCRVGLAPTGKRRLITAHTQSGRHPYYIADKQYFSSTIKLYIHKLRTSRVPGRH